MARGIEAIALPTDEPGPDPPRLAEGSKFLCERLKFRISDLQKGYGAYLRADGAINHHNLLAKIRVVKSRLAVKFGKRKVGV
jgi:hypothetical protein